MSWYKADKSSELKGTLLIDISWQSGPTCWPRNIHFINNWLALPGTKSLPKWMQWAAKPLDIIIKLNMFSCFFPWNIIIMKYLSILIPLLLYFLCKDSLIGTQLSQPEGEKKNRDKYNLSNSLSSKFHKNLWNWLAMVMLSIIWKNIPWIYQT